MKAANPSYFVPLMMVAWTLLNLLQAGFTELFHDEAYYWVYAQNFSIGYFDHPPGIALMIKLGYALLGGELGLRLLVVLASTATVYMLYRMAGRENPLLFFAIVFSIPLVHVGGFFAAPDIPLLLTTSLFFLAYRQYLKNDGWRNVLLLGLVVAAMVWSKYHALMVLFFVILSYPGLLAKRSFWGVVGIATALFLPHLIWAFENGFSSLVYHLGDRSKAAYTFNNTWEYISGEWVAMGPLTAFVVLPMALMRRPEDRWERGLKFVLVGILAFLFLMSFDGRVEANWAATAFIPLVVLAFRKLRGRQKARRWLYYLAVPGIALLLVLRIYLVWNFLPELRQFRSEFHGWPEWAEKISAVAGDAPVIFPNTYQLPSKYQFYAQQPAWSFNSLYYRKNQYDLLPIEEQLQGKRVLYISKASHYKDRPTFQALETGLTGTFYYTFIDSFCSYQKVRIEVLQEELRFGAGDTVKIPLRLSSPYPYPVDFSCNPHFPFSINYAVTQKGKLLWMLRAPVPDLSKQSFSGSWETEVEVEMPPEKGEYEIFFSLANGWLDPGRQGRYRKLVLE
jgi:hypothetical protein